MLMRASTGNAFWMSMLEGASQDARYVAATRNVLHDLVDVSAQDLQKVAAKFLVPAKSFSVEVLPIKPAVASPAQP
jgi:zinc protease